METEFWDLPVEGPDFVDGQSRYTAAMFTRLHQIVATQTKGALYALGEGIVKRPVTAGEVTISTGRIVNIAECLAIARHSVKGPAILHQPSTTFGPLPANRGDDNPIYLFLVWEKTGLHDAWRDAAPIIIQHTAATYDGGVLLAKITTSSSAILAIDNSVKTYSGAGGLTDISDGSVTLAKLASDVTTKFNERPTSDEVDDKIEQALDGFENNTLIAGENITIIDAGDGTKTINATGSLTGTFESRSVEVTTDSLAPNESETITVTLGKYAKLALLQSDAAAWIRLYPSTAAQIADSGRTQNQYFEGDQLIFDYLSVDGPIDALLEAVDAFSREAPRTGDYPLTITNSGAISAAITVTLTFVTMEI
jgi:hypothetical protein